MDWKHIEAMSFELSLQICFPKSIIFLFAFLILWKEWLELYSASLTPSAPKPPSLHQYKPCSKLRTWRRRSTHPGLPLSERIVRLVKPSRGSTSSIAPVAHRTTWSTLFTDVLQAKSKLFGGFHAIDLSYRPWSLSIIILSRSTFARPCVHSSNTLLAF